MGPTRTNEKLFQHKMKFLIIFSILSVIATKTAADFKCYDGTQVGKGQKMSADSFKKKDCDKSKGCSRIYNELLDSLTLGCRLGKSKDECVDENALVTCVCPGKLCNGATSHFTFVSVALATLAVGFFAHF